MSKETQIMQMIKDNRNLWDRFKKFCETQNLKPVALVNGFNTSIDGIVCSYYPTTENWVMQKGNDVLLRDKGYDSFETAITGDTSAKPVQAITAPLVINIPKGVTTITINLV